MITTFKKNKILNEISQILLDMAGDDAHYDVEVEQENEYYDEIEEYKRCSILVAYRHQKEDEIDRTALDAAEHLKNMAPYFFRETEGDDSWGISSRYRGMKEILFELEKKSPLTEDVHEVIRETLEYLKEKL